MSTELTILIAAAALGSCLVAGMFYAFSSFVMPALARLDPAEGVRAMQSINLTVITPSFMAVFLGTAPVSVAAAALALAQGQGAALVLAGAAIYAVGVIGVTMGANQPRNLALAELDPDSPATEAEWSTYVTEWVRWNTIRTAAGVLAAGLNVAALVA